MGQKIVEKVNARSATASEDVGWLFLFPILGPRLPFELGSD